MFLVFPVTPIPYLALFKTRFLVGHNIILLRLAFNSKVVPPQPVIPLFISLWAGNYVRN